MGIGNFFRRFGSQNQLFLSVLTQQATYLLHASAALCEMTETMDPVRWRKLEREIKACEVQGDALLTEFHEQLFEVILRKIRRSDIQNIAMSIDEFLDNINDSAKSIPLYMPKRIDSQIVDFAQYIHAEADSIKKIMLLFGDIKKNYAQIAIQCERLTSVPTTFSKTSTTTRTLQPHVPPCYSFNNQAHSHFRAFTLLLPLP